MRFPVLDRLRGQWSALTRPRRHQGLNCELTKVFVHPLWPCLDVLDDDGHYLIVRHPLRRTKMISSYSIPKANNKSNTERFIRSEQLLLTIKPTLASRQEVICAVSILCTRRHRQRKQDCNSEAGHVRNPNDGARLWSKVSRLVEFSQQLLRFVLW
jgi:hypothetical protein